MRLCSSERATSRTVDGRGSLVRGESLVMNKFLLKPKKEQEEICQRKSLFKTTCKLQGKRCKMVIDSGSTINLISTEMVET